MSEIDRCVDCGGPVFKVDNERLSAANDSLIARVAELEAALREIDILHANARVLVPSLKSIGELAKAWTDEGEDELSDCLYGLAGNLDEIKAKLREVLLP